MSLQRLLDEDRRLVILRCLSEAHDYQLNESLLGRMVETLCLGIIGHDVLRGHLQWLSDQGLLSVEPIDMGGGKQLWTAKLTKLGAEVARGRPWPGIARPSPK